MLPRLVGMELCHILRRAAGCVWLHGVGAAIMVGL